VSRRRSAQPLTRRRFLALGALAALAPSVCAQAGRARIGILGPSPLETSLYAASIVRAFTELGYAEGARATFLYRYADGGSDLYRRQAQDLATRNCDLLIAVRSEPPARALQLARPDGPILFLAVDYDPLASGVVTNLRRPDRNTTGVSVPQGVLVGRRIEILRTLLPKASRLMVFADIYSADQVEAARKAAAAAHFQLMLVQFTSTPYDYNTYLQGQRGVAADAFMTLASPAFARDRQQIQEGLLRLRLPGIGSNPQQAESGYLLTLGSNVPKVTRRVAEIGVRLLAGTKPAAIPVELADEFELVINAGTARALGVKIPDSVRARAARVIE
jgi:putative tryptophan/tyrosine transport system substrate-binding protein